MTFPDEFFGTATKLDPAIVIDGTTYSHAIKWDQPFDEVIVSGTVASVSGTTSKRIVCNRGVQTTSTIVNDGTFGNFLSLKPVVMGGNIVGKSEPWRLYNASNAAGSFRGSDSQKAEPGHALRYNSAAWFITGVDDEAPAQVAWQGTDPIAAVGRYPVATTEFRLPTPPVRGATLELKDDATDVYAGGGVAVEQTASPGTFTILTRKIFDGDADVYPDDATIGAESYYYEEGSGSIIVGTGTESTGTEYLAVFYWRGIIDTNVVSEQVIIEGAGSYGGTSDDVSRVVRTQSADEILNLLVVNKGTNGYGAGYFEFRLTQDDDSPVVALEWGATGFVRAVQRTTVGGALSAVTLLATPTFVGTNEAFLLQFERNGTTVSMRYAEDVAAPSYTDIVDFTFTGLAELQTAYLGVGCESGKFCATANWDADIFFDGDGKMAIRYLQFTEIDSLTLDQGLASSKPIDTVTNLSTGVTMTASATPARDHYQVITGGIRFYNESQGDEIRVVHEVEDDPPAIPGFAPRMIDTENLATPDSTDVNQNKAHWHDVLIVEDPDESLQIVAGESFEVVMPVFRGQVTTLFFDNYDDQTTSWQEMSAGDFYAGASVDGWVLIAKDWADARAVNKVCFRTLRNRIVANGSVFADSVNDLGTAIAGLDDAWIRLGGIGGTAPESISGNVTLLGPTISTFSCLGGGVVIDGYMLGTKKSFSSVLFDSVGAFGITDFPFYDIPASTINYYEGFGDTSFRNPTVVNCGSQSYNTDQEGVFGGLIIIKKNQNFNNFIGSIIESESYFGNAVAASFDISGVGFGDNGILSLMASLGAVCVEARACVKFTNLQYNVFTFNHVLDFADKPVVGYSPENGSNYVVINGVVVLDVVYADGAFVKNISAPIPAPLTTGNLGFRLIGRRKKSGNVYIARFDQFREYDASVYKSYSSGAISTTSVQTGKWTEINITSSIKEALKFQTSEEQDLFFWPTVAGVSPENSDSGLASFAEGIRPNQTVEVLGRRPSGDYIVSHSGGGSNISFDSFLIRDVVARFRLPNGDDIKVPIIRGPISPE